MGQVIINQNSVPPAETNKSELGIQKKYYGDQIVDNGCSSSRKLNLKELFYFQPVVRFTKLPEWDGFWAKAHKTTYVFTRDGQLLKTPHIDVFGERSDHQQIDLAGPYGNILSKRFIKSVRVLLDQIHQEAEVFPHGREIAIVKTSVQNAFMALGNELGRIKDKSPYPESFDPTSTKIEDHDDKYKGEIKPFNEQYEVTVVKDLRVRLSDIQNVLSIYFGSVDLGYTELFELNPAIPFMIAIQDAKNWLGQRLHIIKQKEDAIAEEKSREQSAAALQSSIPATKTKKQNG